MYRWASLKILGPVLWLESLDSGTAMHCCLHLVAESYICQNLGTVDFKLWVCFIFNILLPSSICIPDSLVLWWINYFQGHINHRIQMFHCTPVGIDDIKLYSSTKSVLSSVLSVVWENLGSWIIIFYDTWTFLEVNLKRLFLWNQSCHTIDLSYNP